jgi:predicted phosphodiesterase
VEKFLGFWDTHVGFERRSGHLRPLHDERAISAMLKFARDFKPDHVIFGGDILDCGAVSHHNSGKPGRTEGLKLLRDGQVAEAMLVKPFEALKPKTLTFITGNHEAWIDQLVDATPGLEGCVSAASLMGMKRPRWSFVQQGQLAKLGKLYFAHGDQIKGGEHVAKAAAMNYDRNIMFGHHHTFQAYTKNTPVFEELPRTGVAVPCLCQKDQNYGLGKPNRWAQGFTYGYMHKDGAFNFYVPIIIKGKTVINGRVYKG